MAKKKNWVDQLVSERYFVWAVLFALIVGGGVLAQIAIANIQFDSDAMSTSYLTVPHTTKTNMFHKR